MEFEGINIPKKHEKAVQQVINNAAHVVNCHHANTYMCLLEHYRLTTPVNRLRQEPTITIMRILLRQYNRAKKLADASKPAESDDDEIEEFSDLLADVPRKASGNPRAKNNTVKFSRFA